MAHWTFDVKFPCSTQFIFRSLTFTVGEDGDLKMLPLGPAPEHITLEHGQDPMSPATSSASGGAWILLQGSTFAPLKSFEVF
jgi:hypothetical protein